MLFRSLAYMLVVDTPIFAKTDKRGTAVLDGLSAGEYEVHMWTPGTTAASTVAAQRVKLSAGEAATLMFTSLIKPTVAPAPSTTPSTY